MAFGCAAWHILAPKADYLNATGPNGTRLFGIWVFTVNMMVGEERSHPDPCRGDNSIDFTTVQVPATPFQVIAGLV